MNHSNKKRLYSAIIIVLLILAIGVTIFYGEGKQAMLKKENIKLAEEISKEDNSKGHPSKDNGNTKTPENISENKPDDKKEVLVYSKENINVRSGPGTNYSILGSLSANKKVTLVEKGSNGWSKIIFNGKEGYCYSSYLIEEEI